MSNTAIQNVAARIIRCLRRLTRFEFYSTITFKHAETNASYYVKPYEGFGVASYGLKWFFLNHPNFCYVFTAGEIETFTASTPYDFSQTYDVNEYYGTPSEEVSREIIKKYISFYKEINANPKLYGRLLRAIKTNLQSDGKTPVLSEKNFWNEILGKPDELQKLLGPSVGGYRRKHSGRKHSGRKQSKRSTKRRSSHSKKTRRAQ